MTTSSIRVTTLALFVGAVLYVGCNRRENESVRIGSVLSLSGTLANYGELEKRGFDLAVERVNQAGGVNGRRLEIAYEDSALDPKRAISAYNKLVSVDRVPIIVGCVGSSVCLAVAPLATRDHIVVMSAGATSPNLSGVSPFFFRVAPSDTQGAAVLADWVLDQGGKKIAILYLENDYGLGQKNVTVQRLAERGTKAVLIDSCLPEASDLRPQIERIRKAEPDVVLLLTQSPEAGYFLKQAAEAGFRVPAYGGDALSDPSIVNIAGKAAEGTRFLLPARGGGAGYSEFADAFRARYKAEPDAVAMKAYCLMIVAAEALRKAAYDGDSLRNCLAKIEVDTPMGVVSFDSKGDIGQVQFERLQYKQGRPVPVE